MTRHRAFVLGCPAAIVLLAVIILGIVAVHRGAFEIARSRWAAKGGPNYTLVVSEVCMCYLYGEYRITVRNGQVVAAEPVPNPNWAQPGPTPNQLSDLDHLTVECMFIQAERAQGDAWLVPWFHQISIAYDPTYGYVTSYVSDANGIINYQMGWLAGYVTDSGYRYTAHDFSLTKP